jgi:alkylhydroperoxidase/carboxymuconolactone decarboxylase family protein YurZ
MSGRQKLAAAPHVVKASRPVYVRRHLHSAEEALMALPVPPWIQPLQQRDQKFVDSYMAQREHILADGAIPAKYKHLMTMIVDALQTHGDGVKAIADRARGAGASEAEVLEAVEVTYLFGGTPALVTAMNAFSK